VLVALALLAVPAAAVVADGGGTSLPAATTDAGGDADPGERAATAPTDNESNLTAGQRLGAVVGIGQAEAEGEVAERSFGIQLGAASSNDSKASVVGAKATELRDDLATVRDRIDTLQAARENGTISESEYRTRVAPLAAKAQALERQVNATANASAGLHADVLEANGVDVDAIRTLRADARNLSGGEVAAIARGIGGPETGRPAGVGKPGAGDAGNETRGGDGKNDDDKDGAGAGNAGTSKSVADAADRVSTARDRVAAAQANVTVGGEAAAALTDAEDALARAEAALAAARNATGSDRAEHVETALAAADAAIAHAATAGELAATADGSGTADGTTTTDGADADGSGGDDATTTTDG
jgi:hypothetical protein